MCHAAVKLKSEVLTGGYVCRFGSVANQLGNQFYMSKVTPESQHCEVNQQYGKHCRISPAWALIKICVFTVFGSDNFQNFSISLLISVT